MMLFVRRELSTISLLVLLTEVCDVFATSSSNLFALDGPVNQLTQSNFASVVHRSSQVWVVSFYSAWCGHCQRLAPVFTDFASDIDGWKPVIGVAAVECSAPSNTELCRNYGISGFPTVKLFPPNSDQSERGTVFHDERNVHRLRSEVLRYVMGLVDSGQADSSWPRLTFIRHPSELSSPASSDKQRTFVVIEDQHSISHNTAVMVILDLLPLKSSVVVGRMRLSDSRVLGFVERGLYSTTVFNTLFPINSDYNRRSLVSTIRRAVDIDSSEQQQQPHDVLLSTLAPTQPSPTDNKLEPGLHMQDIESSVYYSLWVEVASRTSFDEDSLNALKLYIDTMYKYLPAERHVRNFLHRTSDWLNRQTAPLATTTWLHHITNTQTDDAYIPDRVRWTWCKGSEARYRGYPCSLWMTFHALTVNAYTGHVSNSSFSPSDVIRSVRGYVEHFLGCRECARHFGTGARRVLDAGTTASRRFLFESDGPALWLWASHNVANWHLRNDVTEDPAHPKIQFPAAVECPTCWLDASRTEWNETAVMSFLVEYYGAPYVVDDDIDVGPHANDVPLTTLLNTAN